MNCRLLPLILTSLLMVPTVQAAGKGTVKIITDPGEAKIYVNGKRKGSSPAKKGQTFAIKLPEGEYTVEAIIAHEFYELHGSKEVYVAEDTLQTLEIKVNQKKLTAAGKAKKQDQENAQKKKVQSVIEQIQQSMVSIPEGSFQMGCVSGLNCRDYEKPLHKVNINAFKLAVTEVTFEQWDACVAAEGCSHYPEDEGWGRGKRPVINVSWDDAQQYIKWLNAASSGGYRLPTEAEWEYAARAGSTTKYSWGNSIDCSKARYSGGKESTCYYRKHDDSYRGTALVSSYPVNAFGLYDMHGNVWEWTQDCWNKSYSGAPRDGSAWQSGECKRRVVRGGSWFDNAVSLRAVFRSGDIAVNHDNGDRGFRLAQDL